MEGKVTTKEVKQIAEKIAVVNTLLTEIKDILQGDNYDAWVRTPFFVDMPLCDLVDLAKVCRKKPEVKRYWNDYSASFSIYGCTFEAPIVNESEVNYHLEKGSVVMKGDK